jgi:hypothetical protein
MKKKPDEIIAPPRQCECGKPGDVAQVEVIHIRTGRTMMGVFSEFREEAYKERVLRPGFRFKQWVVLCGDCFYSQPDQKEISNENADTEND